MSNVVRFPEVGEREPRQRDETPRGPQVEDGYTRIADTLLDALCRAPITSREMRVFLSIALNTYGCGQDQARITSYDLAESTGLHSSDASKAINRLIRRQMLIRHGSSRAPVSINRNTDQWGAVHEDPVWTYLVKNRHTGHIKIGIATKLKSRLKSISKAIGVEIEVLGVCDSDIEKELHALFEDLRLEGEWFQDPDGEIEAQARLYPIPEGAL